MSMFSYIYSLNIIQRIHNFIRFQVAKKIKFICLSSNQADDLL